MFPLRSSCFLFASLVLGCSSGDASDAAADLAGTKGPSSNDAPQVSPGGSSANSADGVTASGSESAPSADTAPAPEAPAVTAPEHEIENSFRVPVVTGKLIWAANPVSGRVALVDALSHQIQTLPAGLSPTYLAALPGAGNNRALVINRGSSDATLFRQNTDGTLAESQIPLHDNATAWTVSDSGRWAIAWSDANEFPTLDPTEGLQDVTVIDLSQDPPRPSRFSVGYRPVKLQIDAQGTRVYAVTHDGISVIELGDTPRLLDDIPIQSAADALSSNAGTPVLDDVPITSDGRYALLRFDGAPRIEVLALAERTATVLSLPSPASDIDLTADGARAVAVLRDKNQIVVFSPEAASADSSAFELRSLSGEILGSAALPDSGQNALLFTNAVDSDRLAIVDLASAATSPRVVSLKAPIRAVFPTPDGSYAVALLATEANSDRAGAFSVVPIAEALPAKIQGTDAPPFAVSLAQTPAGLRGLVTTRDDSHAIYAAYLVRMPSLQVDRIDLPSPPIAVGVLPEYGVGYVAEQHPEGRITFIDLETGAPQTLTGFELADRVVGTSSDGAAP